MDASDWHAFCRAPSPDPPALGRQTNVVQVRGEQRQRHAREVEQFLVRCPAESPLHERLKEGLRDEVATVELEPFGARTITAVTAPFTAGKSTTVKAVARELYRDWMADFADERPRWNPPGHADVEADRIPIIYVNLQSDTSSKDLYAQILTFMGHGASWTRSQLAINTSKAFSIHGVKLVILDDAHMLRTHLKQGQATLDAIKAIATELGEVGGMMILVGAWTGDSDLLDDPQVRGRLSLHQLDVYSIGSDQERALWQRLLKAWEDKIERFLPGMETGDLCQSSARYLYERTQGYVGDLAKCLSQATRRAIREGRDTIVNDDLKMVRLSARAHDHELGNGTTGKRRPRKTRRNVG